MGNKSMSMEAGLAGKAAGGDCCDAAFPVTFPEVRDNMGMADRSTTFHELYVRYAEHVRRFALWLSGSEEEARDITSETFVRAWTAAQEPRMETVKAYLFTIARNLHRQRWRKASRLEELDEAMPDPSRGPDEAAADSEEFQRALAALQTLPEMDRTALLLRAESGMSYEEIASVTGLSVAAARVKVFRARARLAALVKPKLGEKA